MEKSIDNENFWKNVKDVGIIIVGKVFQYAEQYVKAVYDMGYQDGLRENRKEIVIKPSKKRLLRKTKVKNQ